MKFKYTNRIQISNNMWRCKYTITDNIDGKQGQVSGTLARAGRRCRAVQVQEALSLPQHRPRVQPAQAKFHRDQDKHQQTDRVTNRHIHTPADQNIIALNFAQPRFAKFIHRIRPGHFVFYVGNSRMFSDTGKLGNTGAAGKLDFARHVNASAPATRPR